MVYMMTRSHSPSGYHNLHMHHYVHSWHLLLQYVIWLKANRINPFERSGPYIQPMSTGAEQASSLDQSFNILTITVQHVALCV